MKFEEKYIVWKKSI